MEFLPSASEDRSTKPAAAYLEPYHNALRSFGASFETTLWKSRATQTIRFEVLLSLVDLNERRILDAGCGLGDLCDFLIKKNINYSQYLGVDGLEHLVEKGAAKNLPRAEFHARDFVAEPAALALGNPDIIFFSGSLNTIDETTTRKIVRHAFKVARHAVVFNFLSDRCADDIRNHDTGPAHRFNTLAWLEWALQLSTNVVFRQDYLAGHDATIGIIKPGRPDT